MRRQRYGRRHRRRTAAARPLPPAGRPSGLNGIPAVTIMATAMQASTMVVPMSGWAMTSNTSKARTAITGTIW